MHFLHFSGQTVGERKVPTMDMDKVVCYCMGVTNGAVKAAVDAGASTLAEVQAETGASTVCGACMDNVQRLVDFFVKERESKA